MSEKLNQEILTLIRNNKWYKQVGASKAYYIFTPCEGANASLESGLSFFCILNGKILEGIYMENDFIKKAENILCQQKNDYAYIDQQLKKCKEASNALDNFYSRYSKKNIESFNLEQIQSALIELEKLNLHFWTVGYFCDAFDLKGEGMLNNELSNSGIHLTDDEKYVMTKSNYLNYLQEERLDLLKIAKLFREKKINKEQLDEMIKMHAERYFFVDNSWESTTILTELDFRERFNVLNIRTIRELNKEIEYLETDWDSRQHKIITKHSISKSILNIFYLYQKLFAWRDERKKYTLLNNHFYDSFFRRVSIILNIHLKEFNVIDALEITPSLTKEKLSELIKERRDYCIQICYKSQRRMLSNHEAKLYYNALKKHFSHQGKEIKGNCASKGRVTGIVRIIMGESHFTNFKEGEILVAPMTRPEFIPLMRKAAAIVTDEGGITSHAAVISRELGLPCIIGTRVATQALQNGMKVEVDADNGVVRII